MNEINQIETRTKIIDKINRLIEFGCELKLRFEENLQFIDTMMPRLLSLAVCILIYTNSDIKANNR